MRKPGSSNRPDDCQANFSGLLPLALSKVCHDGMSCKALPLASDSHHGPSRWDATVWQLEVELVGFGENISYVVQASAPEVRDEVRHGRQVRAVRHGISPRVEPTSGKRREASSWERGQPTARQC